MPKFQYEGILNTVCDVHVSIRRHNSVAISTNIFNQLKSKSTNKFFWNPSPSWKIILILNIELISRSVHTFHEDKDEAAPVTGRGSL
jgi:hypothetical protein